VIPFGQATETIEFGACGEGCDFRTINLAGGSIFIEETFSNGDCPGACQPNKAEPASGTLTDVIVGGTGIFEGATGTLTGRCGRPGCRARSSSQARSRSSLRAQNRTAAGQCRFGTGRNLVRVSSPGSHRSEDPTKPVTAMPMMSTGRPRRSGVLEIAVCGDERRRRSRPGRLRRRAFAPTRCSSRDAFNEQLSVPGWRWRAAVGRAAMCDPQWQFQGARAPASSSLSPQSGPAELKPAQGKLAGFAVRRTRGRASWKSSTRPVPC